ncbi:MAG: phenylacetic acid degradation bifunctional protein PaaZ, partial [Gemmatimonadetes bacterium 21-71-4]
PEGALQLVCGGAGDLLTHLGCQDAVAFTGSAATGRMLRETPNIVERAVRFNMEADSLNCSILGPDAAPGTEEFDLFVKEVVREMTAKAGQKCTAIRRTIVPAGMEEDVIKALRARLERVVIGDPGVEGVRMGPLATKGQVRDVGAAAAKLREAGALVYGGDADFAVVGADREKGAFFAPMLLACDRPFEHDEPHAVEAFGPVNTVMPYGSVDEAIGRAGGGEEMGGVRGVLHYMQRTAVQGSPTVLTRVMDQWMPGAEEKRDRVHPFRKYFEELEIGETLVTHGRTVTEADVVAFAGISGDFFYAHMDDVAARASIFERRVAHGYFVLSAAAGLFVDPAPGPVLANYGLDNLRFVKPVYIGDTIHVRLTCKQKTVKDTPADGGPQGVVAWDVEVRNQADEAVALYTILTLVRRRGVISE